MNSHKTNFSMLLFITFTAFMLSGLCLENNGEAESQVAPNLANSEKRVLEEDTLRNERLLKLTKHDKLTREIILEHSLIAGSKIKIESRNDVYLWLVDNIRVSAALSRIYGNKYTLSAGTEYDYRGDDGDGLTVEFNRTYRDSVSTVFTGHGKMKLFLFSISGSFINFLEFSNVDKRNMTAQSCMYVRVNNPVTRFITNVVFAISDVEEGIMEKMFTLDDTVYTIVKTLMEDPHIYMMLQHPDATTPTGTSSTAIRIRNTIFMESSRQKAAELGTLIENARLIANE